MVLKKQTKGQENKSYQLFMALVIFTIIVIVLIITISNFIDKANDDRYVGEDCYCIFDTMEFQSTELLTKEYCISFFKDWSEEGAEFICKSYRKKTECELNPNSENCVCEEYNSDIKKTISTFSPLEGLQVNITVDGNCNFCDSTKPSVVFCNESECQIMSSSLCCGIDKCIKAREKTECEKFNSEYIEIEYCDKFKEPIMTCNDSGCLAHNSTCSEYKTICRLKTFEDLTCDELEEGYQNRGIEMCQYVKCSFTDEMCKKGCRTYTMSEIEHKQLLKGCFR